MAYDQRAMHYSLSLVRHPRVPPSLTIRRAPGKQTCFAKLYSKVIHLNYSLPEDFRRSTLPNWFHQFVEQPKYLFRLSGKKLSRRQKVISTLCRLWYSYHFARGGPFAFSSLIKLANEREIFSLLRRLNGRSWYTVGSIVYRRLKVLLRPIMAQ